MRTRIKICGITRIEDALLAIEYGSDALGFVFYEKSPRYITPEQAGIIIEQLPPFVSRVGLFVNASKEYIDEACSKSGIDVIQLHGDESAEFSGLFQKPVIKALPIEKESDLQRINDYKCTVLLDAKAPQGVYGGTGSSFDWSLISELNTTQKVILAGGLNLENIEEALGVSPWYAVDVSSGVEQSKGIKDSAKMKKFCKKVQDFNCRV